MLLGYVFFTFTFLIYTIKTVTAVIKANPSETGILIHTPFTPYKGGNKSIPGSKYTNWRESDRKILIFAIPMLWKKLDITICAPTNGNISVHMRRPDDAISISSSLSVKIAETVYGKSSQIMKPLLVINAPMIIPKRSVCFTRSTFCAP